jgi:hypothetical protein
MPRQPHSVVVPIAGARALPLRVAPLSGEALDSWLEAIAHRYAIPLGDMLSRCGIRPSERTSRWMVSLNRDELGYISRVSGVDIEVVRAMTLERHRGTASDFGSVEGRSGGAPWARRDGSRFCPHCLRESRGRWQLMWRLSWSFACVKHRCLLADSCPVCRSPQCRNTRYASRIPQPGHCPRLRHCHDSRSMLPCSADLGAAHVLLMPRTHPAINAQRTIDVLLNGGRARLPIYGGTPPGSAGVLSDVRLLARWVMFAVDQRQLEQRLPTDLSRFVALHRTSTAWPHGRYWRSARKVPSVLDTAAGVTIALGLMSMPNNAIAASVLQQLMAGANNGSPYRRPISRLAHLSQTVRSVHDAAHAKDNADRRLRSRLARKEATSASVSTRSPNSAR